MLALLVFIRPVQGQDVRKIPISFLPPPLETATFSLGIYDAKNGKLVRRLKEGATQSAFTVGLNGLITDWDGKDDTGKPVPPGKYAARGYAVGALKVEGDEILGNDWTADNEELRFVTVRAMILVPSDNGLIVAGPTPAHESGIARYGGPEGKLLWQRILPSRVVKDNVLSIAGDTVVVATVDGLPTYRLADGSETSPPTQTWQGPGDANLISNGKDGTDWHIEEGVLTQFSAQGERLRNLVPKEGEPVPVAVAASKDADRLYLLESAKNWQRVRGLSWVETKEEDGKPVSTWQTFFERNIRGHDDGLNLESPAAPIEITLMENPLDPGKPQKIRLGAEYDGKGSYLAATDGLRLRLISQRANLKMAKLARGKDRHPNALILYQNDDAATDKFLIEGVKNIMAFDAGEIDMTADGEKTHPEKAAEPPEP